MGSLAFKKNMYHLQPLSELQRLFPSEFLTFHNVSIQSNLEAVFKAGFLILPSILKYHSVSKRSNKAVDTIPLDLPPGFPLFHSIVICPVTKNECNDENPPILLKCGHVLSREAVSVLFKGRLNSKTKCPYCPMESTLQDLKTMYI
jgi:E3 ubiquitin-protein transferase RMND5